MTTRRYTLDTLDEIQLEQQEKGETVVDNTTETEKVIKTVSGAQVVTIVAYMIGIDEEILKAYYSHRYNELLIKLQEHKAATIIRYLSRIRTTILKNFLVIDNAMRYSLSNIDRMDYFEQSEIQTLQKWGVSVVQTNYRSDKYITHITKLMDEFIDECEGLFPESVQFAYIRDLFVIPRYEKNEVLIKEYNQFKGNRLYYPFQMYMHWKPENYGNILYADNKFLSILYKQHGEEFQEGYKYRDACDDTKESIYSFIRKSDQIVMAVDCENVDPYKLFGVLKNLDQEDLRLINKIILYDDYHTTIAWDYLGSMVHIPVEHIEVPRVTDTKSLVDIQMAVGVSAAYYRDHIDSFILCSSDSDFWALISSIPKARFLVMYEYAKCGNAIKEALTSRSIFHCAMDDFYMENAGELQRTVLMKVLEQYLPKVVGEDGWELTKQIYADAYIQATEKEMRRFFERYITHLKLKLNKDGKFCVYVDV